MLKITFTIIVLLHGLIHVMGFAKAFGYGNITQLTRHISKPMGLLWLSTALLFIMVALLFLLKKEAWWMAGMVAVVLSQILIVGVWQDAKFGTIANLIIAVAAVLSWGSFRFERSFQQDVQNNLQRTRSLPAAFITEADLQPLPAPVQRYLRYVGVVGKPKVNSVRIVFDGEMREKGKDWFPFTSTQYNFFDEPTRLFFMRGKLFGVTVPGYHRYVEAEATMDIRLFGLFPVVKQSGVVMNQAETVTLFNDMCLMVPATLIDPRIEWEAIDSTTAKATFTNRGIAISATLYFNDLGQLIDFRSNDRTAVADMNQYPFSTPASAYHNINGINVATYGEAVWHYPDGEFVYGKFRLKEIEYNVMH